MTPKAFRPAVLAAFAVAVAVPAVAYAASSPLLLGPSTQTQQTTYVGYYDGHKDTYVITDVSSKSQASALHVNYSAALATFKGAPAQYFVQGPAATGQITVFGSEPGKPDYNPLWVEVFVTWKAGTKPVLLTSDNQIMPLAKSGKLSLRTTTIVLNAPITHVGK
jgi:hypothetical protein